MRIGPPSVLVVIQMAHTDLCANDISTRTVLTALRTGDVYGLREADPTRI